MLYTTEQYQQLKDIYIYMYSSARWPVNIIVLNAHAPTEEKSDDSKEGLYEELQQVFDHFLK